MIVPDGGALPEPVMLEREPDPDSCLCAAIMSSGREFQYLLSNFVFWRFIRVHSTLQLVRGASSHIHVEVAPLRAAGETTEDGVKASQPYFDLRYSLSAAIH